MLGTHIIKGWSTTQFEIALSSGEAEYYGIVKAATMSTGVREILADLGLSMQIVIKTDASAAKGITNTVGLGKLRHLDTNLLWIQERVASSEIIVEKVPGITDIADALTKHVDGPDLNTHIEWINAVIKQGRHEKMPNLADDMAVSLIHGEIMQVRESYL